MDFILVQERVCVCVCKRSLALLVVRLNFHIRYANFVPHGIIESDVEKEREGGGGAVWDKEKRTQIRVFIQTVSIELWENNMQ